MFARLTCRRGSHVSDAEISFGTSVHGLPASTDADFSERQRTACPHYDSIISCGVSHTVWFQSHDVSSREGFTDDVSSVVYVWHFPGKALPVQNVMLPTLQETLRNFVADTLGEPPQEQYLRPRCT